MPLLDEYRVLPAIIGVGWTFRVTPRGEQPFTVSGFATAEDAMGAAANHYASRMGSQTADALRDPAYVRGKARTAYMDDALDRFRRT